MIDEGDIVLKNKEERTVFSDTGKFSGEVSGLCTRYRELEKQCREAEEGLLSHPVLARLRSLEREKEQLKGMRVHEEEGQKDLLEWRTKLQTSVPLLQEELVKKMEEMAGETVQFQMNEPVRG
jgi:predicted  nucleic acid-binding Zn-ribbon protein